MEKEKEKTIAIEGEPSQTWYYKPWVITIAILSCGPLGLIPLWFRPKTQLYAKVFVSAVVIAITVWMSVGATKYYKHLLEYYKGLSEAF